MVCRAMILVDLTWRHGDILVHLLVSQDELFNYRTRYSCRIISRNWVSAGHTELLIYKAKREGILDIAIKKNVVGIQ
jgi:hypothetical protein